LEESLGREESLAARVGAGGRMARFARREEEAAVRERRVAALSVRGE